MTGAETAFDSYAAAYDAHFTVSRTGQLQRSRVWKYLSRLSPAEFPSLLELNCGTGEDAAWLAKRGFIVTASDLSSGMVEQTKQKLTAAGLKGEVQKADAREVATVFAGKKFDLVFSDFGGMNCLSPEELKSFSVKLATLLRPGARVVFVVMGRKCRWERFYFRRKNEREKAVRRMQREPVTAIIGERQFPVWYYSPEEFAAFFPAFTFVRKKPVGLFIPPSYLESWAVRRPNLLAFLNFLEIAFPFSFLSDQADHYFLELKFRGA